VKLTLSATDPFDSEIILVLEKEKNKAGYIRKAVFCYIKGLGIQQVNTQHASPKPKERDRALDNKLSKLTDL
jgi:hypothetical protein